MRLWRGGNSRGHGTEFNANGSNNFKIKTMENLGNKKPLLTGMFSDRESAEKAYGTLHERGYTSEDVNLIMSDETRRKHFAHDHGNSELGTKAMEGLGTGSAIGGTIGAIAGIVAAIGTSIVLPGLGLVIAGPIAAGLAGAGAGGITGGIIGALVGWGIPEDRAKRYASGLKEGKIVMGVHPKNEEDARHLENTWRTHRAEDIYTH
jgi:hypothetical protein